MIDEDLTKAYKFVFATPEGEAVLRDLANQVRMGIAADIGTPSDHLQYTEGARSVYQYICQIIAVDLTE